MGQWKKTLGNLVATGDHLLDLTRQRIWQYRPPKGPFLIVPFISYGTRDRLLLSGRVLKDKQFLPPLAAHTRRQNLVEFYKQLASRELPGARVRARFQNQQQEATTDHEGYFNFSMSPGAQFTQSGWLQVALELIEPQPAGAPVVATARVLVPPETARFGVISDIDDTVVWTNAGRRLTMLRMLMHANAHTRKPFKGVAGFYQALQKGASGADNNPIFYVSSSPWNLYMPLIDFLEVQQIPLGPLLLKDYGDHTLFASDDHHSHKLASIEQILHTYADLPFVLIGDSGEQDPEIYREIVARYPERIRAIYIRSVNPDPSRIEAIDRLAEEVRLSGTQLVLVPDSEFAAIHAAAQNLIAPQSIASVRIDKNEDEPASGAGDAR